MVSTREQCRNFYAGVSVALHHKFRLPPYSSYCTKKILGPFFVISSVCFIVLLFPAIPLPSDPCHFAHLFCGRTSSRPRTPKQNHIETFYSQALLYFHSESPCVFLTDLIFISHQKCSFSFRDWASRGPTPINTAKIRTCRGGGFP